MIVNNYDVEFEIGLLREGAGHSIFDCAFAIANRHPAITRIFEGSEWPGTGGHVRVLRRLPGVENGGRHRWKELVLHSTMVPGSLLDDG